MVLKLQKCNRLILVLLFAMAYIPFSGQSVCAEDQLEKLKSAITSNPNNPNAHFNLGLFYYQNGKYDEAISELNKVISLNVKDQEALVLLGTIHLRLGQLDDSERYFEQALQINPNSVDARNNLSLVYLNQKKNDAAIQCLQESLRVKTDNPEALVNLAFIYTALNRGDEAISVYKRLLKINPQNVSAYEQLAQMYYEQQKYPEILKLFNEAKSEKVSVSAKFYNEVAFAYLAQGEIKTAHDFFSQASKINPGDAESHFGIGLIAYKKANLDFAIKELKLALKLKKDYLEAYRQLAIAYEDKGEYIKALYLYRQVLKIDPEDNVAKRSYQTIRDKALDHYLRKGSKAYFEEDYETAVKSWKMVLKLDPGNENATKFINTAAIKLAAKVREHNEKASSYFSRGLQQDAYREWGAALRLDPQNKESLSGIEKVNLKSQEKDEIKAALAMDSLKKGNVKIALKDLATTLKKDPNNQIVQQNVKKIQTEQKSGSERDYRKGIELFSTGKLREAISALERALEVDQKNQGIKNLLYKARTQLRENIKALLGRGVELANAGRVAEAKEKFNEVMQLDPDNSEANEYLTKFTGKVAQVTVSKEEIKKLYYDGVSLYLDGQNRRAIEVWKKILVLDPDNQEAKSSIAKAEMELKEMEKRGIKTQ